MEVDSIPQQPQEKTAQIDSADLVVGIFADLGQDGVKMLCEGLRSLQRSPRIVILQRDPVGGAGAANSQSVHEEASFSFLPWSAAGPDPLGAPTQSISIDFLRRTKHCWQNYVDYHKCILAKGEDFRPCRQV